MTVTGTFPQLEDLPYEEFRQLYLQTFGQEVYRSEILTIIKDAIKNEELADDFVSLTKLNDLVDLYQFNHIIKTHDKKNNELKKMIDEIKD